MPTASYFCQNCKALYQIVKVEAGPQTADREVTCRDCGAPFPARGLARLGVSIAVIEQILNHRGGSLAGVAGVYIRHQFEKEKREALQQWADYVERLISASHVP
jgi:hypothetical protein